MRVIPMALKVKSTTTYNLNDDLANFFSVPVDLPSDDTSIADNLKKRVYSLDIDTEEKSNLISKINKYNTINSIKEKNKLREEIESFLEDYE